jgi:hypothetical protein
MRFKLGLAIGFAAGYWYGSLPEDERKRQVDEAVAKVKGNPRLQRVTDTVSRNASKVTDAVEQKVVGTADRAGSVVASKVPAGGAGASGASGSSREEDDEAAATTLQKMQGTGIG